MQPSADTKPTIDAQDGETRAAGGPKSVGGVGPRAYQPRAGVYDEAMDASGAVRDGWRPFFEWFGQTPDARQAHAAEQIDRLIVDNFSDPARGGTPWRLNTAPMLINGATWRFLEAASIQRARLYEAVLQDLYGPQQLLRDGSIPPALVYSDEMFLRPLHGVTPAHGYLTFLALDFARDASGGWRIIDAHAETPAGHGFVLANRMVLGEVVGRVFRTTHTRRIAPFYQKLGDDLLRRAGGDTPTLAILTGSPDSADFVGHAFMARYLGQLRVEGSDLRVAGNKLYLKTVNGLQKIDLLIRAVAGHLADPLELSPTGFDGPVGLVEACRKSPGLVVNALGTALVESRGLSGYLAHLARQVLGEELMIFDSPRLWLGDPVARADVLANLEDFIVHETQEGTGSPGQAAQGRSAANLDDESRRKLELDIQFRANNLVAERPVGFATAPVWTADGLRNEPFAIRLFVANINGSFEVMPGGLALTVDSGSTVALSSADGKSRDVWIVDDQPARPVINLKRLAAQHSEVQRRALGLQSRMADNLFWLGRYCERADGLLRILRQTIEHGTADLIGEPNDEFSTRAIGVIVDGPAADEAGAAAAPTTAQADPAMWLTQVCLGEDAQGLRSVIDDIRSVAMRCRERLSEASWRTLMRLSTTGLDCQPTMPEAPSDPTAGAGNAITPSSATPADMILAVDELQQAISAFAGMTHENMTRDTGWRFLDLGRRIERARQISDLLLLLNEKPTSELTERDHLLTILQVADSYITYRARYRFAPEPTLVLDLLLIDETNPRSLVYQLSRVSELIGNLPKSADDALRAPDQRLALELVTQVRLADVEALATRAADGQRGELAALLNGVRDSLPELSELLSRQYFSLADDTPQRLRSGMPQ